MIALIGECASSCSAWGMSPFVAMAIVGAQVLALNAGISLGQHVSLRRGRS
jgi:hypothetical protein